MKVFAELSPTQEHIDVHFKYDAQLVAMAKEVPGYNTSRLSRTRASPSP
jgi:hypothetical protein